MGTTHLGGPGGPSAPWWVVPPSGHPPRCCSVPLVVFWSIKSFAVFGLHLILISCDVKNKQKNSNWHWVNRLVPKNDIKLL